MAATPPAPAPPEGRRNRAALVAGVLVALVAVGVGGYFVGKAVADAPAAKREGREQGRGEATRDYAPGQPRYRAIYDAGYAAGRARGQAAGQQAGQRAGEQQGERVGFQRGRAQGDAEGEAEGARAALGGFTDWQTGSLYVVSFTANPQPDIPFAIVQRHQMQSGRLYEPCPQNNQQLCSRVNTTGR